MRNPETIEFARDVRVADHHKLDKLMAQCSRAPTSPRQAGCAISPNCLKNIWITYLRRKHEAEKTLSHKPTQNQHAESVQPPQEG